MHCVRVTGNKSSSSSIGSDSNTRSINSECASMCRRIFGRIEFHCVCHWKSYMHFWCDDCNWSDLHAKLDTMEAKRAGEKRRQHRKSCPAAAAVAQWTEIFLNSMFNGCEQKLARTGTEMPQICIAYVVEPLTGDTLPHAKRWITIIVYAPNWTLI